MMDQILRPSRGVQTHQGSPFLTCPIGKGIRLILFTDACKENINTEVLNHTVNSRRQKVCCGIVYKGRFGEVIIDPRLFKPCCNAKKRPALAASPDTQIPPTLPSPLPEDMKEAWWSTYHTTRRLFEDLIALSPVVDSDIIPLLVNCMS